MPSPTAVTVTGPLLGAIGGTAHAQLTATVALPGGGVRAGGPVGPVVDAPIGPAGTFSLALLATDDAGTTPAGQAYSIWADLYTATGPAHLAPALYEVLAADGPSVPLDNLTPLGTTPPVGVTYVTRAQWLGLVGYLYPDGVTITETNGALTVIGAASVPSGPAGGALGGTYPNPTVPGLATEASARAAADSSEASTRAAADAAEATARANADSSEATARASGDSTNAGAVTAEASARAAAIITHQRLELNFTATGAAWHKAEGAEVWDVVGTPDGTFTYEKSVAATPDTFATVTPPVTLAINDTLQMTCAALRTGPPARGTLTMKRTA